MRSVLWSLVTVTCSALAGGGATWYLFMPAGEPPAAAESDHVPEMTAADFFREATQLLQSPPSELANGSLETKIDILRQLAIRRQTEHPAELPTAWLEFQQLLKASTRLPLEPAGTNETQKQLDSDLPLLLSYEDDVEAAALACRSQADFETVWHVRDEVEATIEARRAELLKTVHSRLDRFNGESKDKDASAVLEDFANLKHELEGSVLTLVATSKTDGANTDLEEVRMTVASLQKRAIEKIGTIRAESNQYAVMLRDGGTAIEPAEPSESTDGQPGKKLGECEQWIAHLQSLDAALDRADLLGWLAILDRLPKETGAQDATTSPDGKTTVAVANPKTAGSTSTDELVRAIGEADMELRRIQQLAYNLWALREIEAAETVDTWSHRLSRIDAGLLQATVGPLYSSVYGRRIEEIEDPHDRLLKVQGMLTGPKIGLESF